MRVWLIAAAALLVAVVPSLYVSIRADQLRSEELTAVLTSADYDSQAHTEAMRGDVLGLRAYYEGMSENWLARADRAAVAYERLRHVPVYGIWAGGE